MLIIKSEPINIRLLGAHWALKLLENTISKKALIDSGAFFNNCLILSMTRHCIIWRFDRDWDYDVIPVDPCSHINQTFQFKFNCTLIISDVTFVGQVGNDFIYTPSLFCRYIPQYGSIMAYLGKYQKLFSKYIIILLYHYVERIGYNKVEAWSFHMFVETLQFMTLFSTLYPGW